jgi:threonine/homoserine/homoserine lactone efflux protein
MMNWQLFSAFLALTVVLLIVPGPIVTLLISTSATEGLRAGLTTVAGTVMGSAVQLSLIATGLTWILANAGEVFELLRWIGAIYLIWLGIGSWRTSGGPASPPPPGLANIRRGFLVALTNPKGLAFFSAFLPQFVDASLPAGPQLAIMCTVTVLLSALTDSGWAIAVGMGRAWLAEAGRARLLKRLAGSLLIGGGVWLLLARRTA